SALDRFYAVKDGWLRIQAPDVRSLQSAGLLREDVTLIIDAEVSAALASRTLADAIGCLNAAGVPCAPARQPADLPADPCIRQLDVFATQHMQDGTPFYVTNRYARLSRTQEQTVFVAPGIGEHSREVLEEAGVPAADIEALLAAGAVTQGQPFRVASIQSYR